MKQELWAPLSGHEDKYEVSTHGNVRHLAWRRDGVLRNLKQNYNKGYPFVTIRVGNKFKKVPIHRAVLTAFVRAPLVGEEACHLDGDRNNARLENLMWASHTVNESHKTAHGTSSAGERNASAKLTYRDVESIRELLSSNTLTQREIAKQFGICQQNVCLIKSAATWASPGWSSVTD
jgi:hypothetical protein